MGGTWTPEEYEELLASALACPVSVSFGRSRTVPVRAKGVRLEGRPGYAVRLHHMFALAPDQVRSDLAHWMRAGRRAPKICARLDAWIERTLKEQPAPLRRRSRLAPVGEVHDLEGLAAPLFATTFALDFGDRPRAGLTWGSRRRSRSRRSLRLGSYDPETNVARIHPVLDQAGVPTWFVTYVLMHEILHAALPPHQEPSGRWVHHSPAFRRRERAYPEYRRALAWEERNLARLIRSAREGTTFRAARTPVLEHVERLLFDEPR
ncbi:MAG: hypothetical protein O2816_18475 [Planctomycetota bacterium]|nr:hypothetical protein [Planctomycetota bacterium]